MKLIYVANIRIPTEKAHGIQVMKMCESFARAGTEVELVVPSRQNSIPTEAFHYHGVEPLFRIKRLPTIDILGWGKIGFYLQLLTYITSLFCFLVGKRIRNGSDDTVVYVRGEPILFLGWIARYVYPVFWETHIKPPAYLQAYLRVIRALKGVVTVTDYYKQELRNVYSIAPEVCWAPDGVDITQINISSSLNDVRTKLGLPHDKTLVLYTGSFYLYDYKGVDVLIEASQYLPEGYLVVLVGGSPKDIERIKASGVTLQNVLLIPHVPHTDIPLYLRSADVLVLPNKKGDEISEKYTSPLKLFEYMAAKKPIVSSNTICLKEILNDTNAYLFEASNANLLAKAVLDVGRDKEVADRRINQAFADVLELTWEKRAKVIITFIQKQISA